MSKSNQHLSVQAAEGTTYFVIGDIITVKVSGDDTEGAYLVVEAISQPGGGAWFLHTHEPQETFYILEGTFEIYGQAENGEKYAIRAEVGDTVHVPANTPHGFKNVSVGIGRMILTYEPAEPMLAFFKQVGIPMTDRQSIPDVSEQLSPETIMSIMQKHLTIIEMPG